MATEKLTIATPLSIRVTETERARVRGLADLAGMEVSDYVRHLVSVEWAAQQQIWSARNQLFGTKESNSTSESSDDVGRSL